MKVPVLKDVFDLFYLGTGKNSYSWCLKLCLTMPEAPSEMFVFVLNYGAVGFFQHISVNPQRLNRGNIGCVRVCSFVSVLVCWSVSGSYEKGYPIHAYTLFFIRTIL